MIKRITHDQLKISSIYYLGDIHANIGLIMQYIKFQGVKNCVIFQVGDFGMGFGGCNPDAMKKLNRVLKVNNVHLYAIRGNHDDPAPFNNEYIYSNIFLVQDNTILDLMIDGEINTHFCNGGAISIDRVQRQHEYVKDHKRKSWWEDEKVNFITDDNILNEITGIQTIITHTAPDWLEPLKFGGIVYHYAQNDKPLLDELTEERKSMSTMMNKIIENNKETLKAYYYGHFHFTELLFHNDVRYQLLNVGELKNG